MLLREVILGFLWKIRKITLQNLLWPNGYSKKLHGMLKNIFRDIGYVCLVNIMKSTRNNLSWDFLWYAQEYFKKGRKSILESTKIIWLYFQNREKIKSASVIQSIEFLKKCTKTVFQGKKQNRIPLKTN